jgi:hypothetical protein
VAFRRRPVFGAALFYLHFSNFTTMVTKKGRQPDNPFAPMYSIHIITRDASGNSIGHREFETPNAGELADWYNRNAWNRNQVTLNKSKKKRNNGENR